ncbi:hypothetical protein NHQ30_008566 [Ciborinia camelliae]|nr:hypothetical protein NHQ30_008566 [Ciborinia camelliae]
MEFTSEEIPDLKAHVYTAVPGFALKNAPLTYTITKAGFSGPVDKIRMDKTENSINILYDDNKEDKTANKLRLCITPSDTNTSKSTGDENTAFDNLQKTAFGKNVARLHEDFGSGVAMSFVITGDLEQPNLTVHVK